MKDFYLHYAVMEDVSTMKYLLLNKGGLDINRKDKVRKLHLFIMMMIMVVIIHSRDTTDPIIHGSYGDVHNTLRMFSIWLCQWCYHINYIHVILILTYIRIIIHILIGLNSTYACLYYQFLSRIITIIMVHFNFLYELVVAVVLSAA